MSDIILFFTNQEFLIIPTFWQLFIYLHQWYKKQTYNKSFIYTQSGLANTMHIGSKGNKLWVQLVISSVSCT